MFPAIRGTLRQRILASVGALVILSLFGSSLSLYRITAVNRSLDAINRVSVPLGRLLVQIQSDVEIYRRELDRRLGNSHWQDAHWHPRPIPRWIEEVIENEIQRVQDLIGKDLPWAAPDARERWRNWVDGLRGGFRGLQESASKLYGALSQKDMDLAAQIYPEWNSSLESWVHQLQWGVNEYDRSLRQGFASAESLVAHLRTGLEIILGVVVSLSLLLLWLGERALRPLSDLARLAREITRRGLRKEDKALLPDIALSRNDEVSQLAREFHRMATALLEREKTVETHRARVQEQNRLLREIGELNQNILNSIDSVLIVTDLGGTITQCNPVAAQWLGQSSDRIIGTQLSNWPKLRAFPGAESWLTLLLAGGSSFRIEPHSIDQKVYGGHLLQLKSEGELPRGAIIALEDLTAELDIQERLRSAEKLAAVGRMSAQVAHEVRNPLHSIGLEAEMAAELASKLGSRALKQSLESILASVDRLEKITENYLKLSKLSAGTSSSFDLGEALEEVLATYLAAFEAQGVRVDWSRPELGSLVVRGDRELLENVLGNLLRNSLQALESAKPAGGARVSCRLGNTESGKVWLRVEDNGPGVPAAIRDKLFTPFVTTRANGTGLGLSFVKKVIEDHGGTIQYVHKPEGACFEILLPAAMGAEVAVGSLPVEVGMEVAADVH